MYDLASPPGRLKISLKGLLLFGSQMISLHFMQIVDALHWSCIIFAGFGNVMLGVIKKEDVDVAHGSSAASEYDAFLQNPNYVNESVSRYLYKR